MQDRIWHGQRAQTLSSVAREQIPLAKRVALSPAQFAALCRRHPSWAYRNLYSGKIRALTGLGRILIPASELERVLSSAAPYNPEARTPKIQSPQSSAKNGGISK
jgi:hypothetical protein